MVKVKIYALALLLTIILVGSTLTLNWYIGSQRDDQIHETYSSIQRSIASSQLEFEYIDKYADGNCELFDEAIMITRTNLVGINQKLERYKEYLISDNEFNRLKADQTILYTKIWMIGMDMKEKCDIDLTILLYFWDNSATSKQQGYVLDSITAEHENVLVIPLDYNFDIGIMELLKTDNDITSSPTILINGETKLEGLNSKDEIEKFL